MDAGTLLLILQILATSVGLTIGVVTLWPKGESAFREINLYDRVRALEAWQDEHESVEHMKA